MERRLDSAIEELETVLGADWAALRAARVNARGLRSGLAEKLANLAPEDTTIVVFGSVAREETTSGSDLDWTLLIDGSSNPQHLDAALEIEQVLEDHDYNKPGPEGTFGGLASSHDIIHKIGGDQDTNRNTTQRILLLLESAPIGDDEAHKRVIRNVLKRYIVEDYGWTQKTVSVPRFLLNDIARYWRTVAVDFAYKRKQRRGKGWALRTVKLRMSRKLTFASGLLACFDLAVNPPQAPTEGSGTDVERTHPAVERLVQLVERTPLEVVARTILNHEELHPAGELIFSSYDEFLALLDDAEARKHLEELAPADAPADRLYEQAREISHRFQDGLNHVFLEDGSPFFELTKKYGVF